MFSYFSIADQLGVNLLLLYGIITIPIRIIHSSGGISGVKLDQQERFLSIVKL